MITSPTPILIQNQPFYTLVFPSEIVGLLVLSYQTTYNVQPVYNAKNERMSQIHKFSEIVSE